VQLKHLLAQDFKRKAGLLCFCGQTPWYCSWSSDFRDQKNGLE